MVNTTNTFTIPDNISDITFIGSDYSVCAVEMNNKSIQLCSFYNCAITGTITSGIESFHQCLIMLDSNIDGSQFFDCEIAYIGTNYLQISGSLNFVRCIFYGAQIFSHQISISGGTGKTLLRCLSANSDICGNGLAVILNSDCTQGTVNVYGDVTVTDSRVTTLTGVTGGLSLATGTNTIASPTVMTFPTFSATPSVLVGLTIKNTTDGSSGVIIANTETTVTVTALSGGISNTWAIGDAFSIERGILVDGMANFVPNSLVGLTATNITDGSSGIITANNGAIVTVFLSGGTNNTWTNGDSYSIALNNLLTDNSLEAFIK